MSVPSTCPECDSLLRHAKPAPGGVDAPLEAYCPNCEYEETIAEPDRAGVH